MVQQSVKIYGDLDAFWLRTNSPATLIMYHLNNFKVKLNAWVRPYAIWD